MMLLVGSLLLMTLSACAPPALPPLPAEVAGWKLEGQPAGSPPVYRYQGPGGAAIAVTVHEYTSETVAFEAIQKWQVAPGTMPLHQGRRILVAAGAEPAQLRALLTALRPLVR